VNFMHQEYLSKAEVENLTGYKQRTKQIRRLVELKVTCVPRDRDYPLVLRSSINQLFGSDSTSSVPGLLGRY